MVKLVVFGDTRGYVLQSLANMNNVRIRNRLTFADYTENINRHYYLYLDEKDHCIYIVTHKKSPELKQILDAPHIEVWSIVNGSMEHFTKWKRVFKHASFVMYFLPFPNKYIELERFRDEITRFQRLCLGEWFNKSDVYCILSQYQLTQMRRLWKDDQLSFRKKPHYHQCDVNSSKEYCGLEFYFENLAPNSKCLTYHTMSEPKIFLELVRQLIREIVPWTQEQWITKKLSIILPNGHNTPVKKLDSSEEILEEPIDKSPVVFSKEKLKLDISPRLDSDSKSTSTNNSNNSSQYNTPRGGHQSNSLSSYFKSLFTSPKVNNIPLTNETSKHPISENHIKKIYFGESFDIVKQSHLVKEIQSSRNVKKESNVKKDDTSNNQQTNKKLDTKRRSQSCEELESLMNRGPRISDSIFIRELPQDHLDFTNQRIEEYLKDTSMSIPEHDTSIDLQNEVIQ